ncbi:DUF3311 domain-containing protein [Porphyrobacter algicida]|uniref:DUF3311 domain-containing protein n=1 Tax=Qipengyuania algicida TaxID=1836209 RepID=A0A845AJF6_9SPHN|nr:DUF3311 domain-containing protein [Qipengyuania algicida]MXP29293.1 DUF3311 domain-containing protein [Qipengyuania algicida]
MHESDQRPARRWHLALLLIPFVWQVALLPFINDVKVDWFAIPFPMVWQMAGIVIATIAIGVVFRIDRQNDHTDGDQIKNEDEPK